MTDPGNPPVARISSRFWLSTRMFCGTSHPRKVTIASKCVSTSWIPVVTDLRSSRTWKNSVFLSSLPRELIWSYASSANDRFCSTASSVARDIFSWSVEMRVSHELNESVWGSSSLSDISPASPVDRCFPQLIRCDSVLISSRWKNLLFAKKSRGANRFWANENLPAIFSVLVDSRLFSVSLSELYCEYVSTTALALTAAKSTRVVMDIVATIWIGRAYCLW